MADNNPSRNKHECVALLHGLGRTKVSMTIPGMRFRARGYETVNINYPSKRKSLHELADLVASKLPQTGTKVHFFTHSLGGMVVRAIMKLHRPENPGRVVMLAPPNRGSALACVLDRNPVSSYLLGPSGRQVAVDASEMDDLLGPVDFDLGVIAGDKPLEPVSRFMPRPNDGVVAVEEAKTEGMKDFLVVHREHTFIMNDPVTVDQAVHFYEKGFFRK